MKIDHSKFIDYLFVENGFKFKSSDYKTVERLFNQRPSGQLFGIKEDGNRTLIDSK